MEWIEIMTGVSGIQSLGSGSSCQSLYLTLWWNTDLRRCFTALFGMRSDLDTIIVTGLCAKNSRPYRLPMGLIIGVSGAVFSLG